MTNNAFGWHCAWLKLFFKKSTGLAKHESTNCRCLKMQYYSFCFQCTIQRLRVSQCVPVKLVLCPIKTCRLWASFCLFVEEEDWTGQRVNLSLVNPAHIKPLLDGFRRRMLKRWAVVISVHELSDSESARWNFSVLLWINKNDFVNSYEWRSRHVWKWAADTPKRFALRCMHNDSPEITLEMS